MTNFDQNIVISKEDANSRLDKCLSDKFQTKSRSYFQYLIENGSVLLNGCKTKKRILVKENDEIEIFFQAKEDISLEAEDIPLDIIYEDDHLIAINKPAGMVVHPAVGNWSGTFVNGLIYHCKNLKTNNNDLRPGIVHRIDKDTTGVLIAAKTTLCHQRLIELFQKRQMLKKYLAICLSKPNNTILNAPIKRHPVNRQKMAIVEGGKEAITEFKILAYNEKFSLIECYPKTGRTHQIRVHLKHLNSPVLGDDVYGNKSINKNYNATRHLLHAFSLEFIHPTSNKLITLKAPIPKDIQHYVELLNINL